jgi:hypothetical protein
MDETTNGISVNITNSITNGAVTNSYENALKKLIHILKLKSNDKLNQLEKLWDSINVVSVPVGSASPPSSLNNKSPPYARTSPTHELNSTTSVKRDSSKLSDSSSDTNTNSKRFKTNDTDNSKTVLNKQPPTKPISTLTKSSTSASLAAKNVNNSNNVKSSSNPSLNSKSKSPTNSDILIETSTEVSSLIKTNNQPVKMDINNEVVDMLDFSCSICKSVFFFVFLFKI